jgi:hypothetical protein
MTQFEPRTKGTGVEVFFIKYRKIITILSIALLLYFPVDIWLSPSLGPGRTFQTIGSWLNDVITYVAVPLGLLIYTRRVTKAHFKEVALIDEKLKDE